MSLIRNFPVIWLGALALCGLIIFVAVEQNDTQENLETGILTVDGSKSDADSSDRDNAAEEVRAVATRISNIEQAIENQTQINKTARDGLRASIKRDLEEMKQSIEESAPRESIDHIVLSVSDLESRMNTLEHPQPPVQDEFSEFGESRSQLHWVTSVDSDRLSLPYETLQAGLFGSGRGTLDVPPSLESGQETKDIPHFTIPATTTLIGATALTALVGRIPTRGQLRDPWRFKVLIGSKNLAANGHRIPQLAGMLLAGTARGDLSLNCVSGNIDIATFIFTDGTIQTARKAASPETSYAGLGWISDEFGNPCIPGELKSNALPYLAQATLINATKATAEAISNAQTETTTASGTGDTSTSIVGDINKFVTGYATKETLSTVADWLSNQHLNSFDAIYVPAGQSVAIHIEETIQIDQDPTARRVQNFHQLSAQANARQGWID